MPAKKKQGSSKAATAQQQNSAAAADSEIDQIQQMANEVFKEAGLTTKEQREKRKEMENAYKFMAEQEMMYRKQQAIQRMLQHHAMEEEQKVANRTQQPITEPALEKHNTVWQQLSPGKWIRYEQFTPEYMEQVIKLFSEELPEPYSVFTYEHFLSGWPVLGILLFGHEGETAPATETAGGALIGSCVSRVTYKYPQHHDRGYIAMLAVRPSWRGHRLGQRLVKVSVEIMKRKKVTEVVLETPTSNDRALKLYTEMGFAKTKYLTRYYLDGSDAIRLKLWFNSPPVRS